MKFIDILRKEIPLTKKYYLALKRYRSGQFQDVPETLQRDIKKLKIVSLTSSGLEKVDSLMILLAATHVIAQDSLDEMITKTAPKKTRGLPKRL